MRRDQMGRWAGWAGGGHGMGRSSWTRWALGMGLRRTFEGPRGAWGWGMKSETIGGRASCWGRGHGPRRAHQRDAPGKHGGDRQGGSLRSGRDASGEHGRIVGGLRRDSGRVAPGSWEDCFKQSDGMHQGSTGASSWQSCGVGLFVRAVAREGRGRQEGERRAENAMALCTIVASVRRRGVGWRRAVRRLSPRASRAGPGLRP